MKIQKMKDNNHWKIAREPFFLFIHGLIMSKRYSGLSIKLHNNNALINKRYRNCMKISNQFENKISLSNLEI